MSRDKVSLPGKPSRNPKRVGILLLLIASVIGLGAARASIPEAPTRGIGYHGEAGRSGNTVQR